MPSEKILSEKKQIVADLTEKLKNASSGVFVDYKGINVVNDTKLRADLRNADVEYSVIKNTLVRFAVNEIGFGELESILSGTTALAVSKEDPIAPAKILAAYAEKSKTFTIKGGFVDGKVVSVEEIMRLAKLPSKEILVATVLGTLNAPIAALARAIQAIADSQGASAPEEAPAAEAPVAEEAAPEAPAAVEAAPEAPVVEEAAPEAPAEEAPAAE